MMVAFCDLFVLWNGNQYSAYKCFKERTKALPWQPTFSSIIMRYSTFGFEYTLYYSKYLCQFMAMAIANLLQCWRGTDKLNLLCMRTAAKKTMNQWTRLSIHFLCGSDLARSCDKSITFSVFRAWLFTCSVSHLDHVRGSGGGGWVSSWIQRTYCFAK